MAKINIDFNNQTYEIDESALAKAAASLSSHLSTVMNGSGATINLNGVTYNVDSTKLTTATNAFVSHLGTVSGTGSKVVVNGVEYSVDATKMTKATADLQAVLGDLVSGGNAGGDSDAPVQSEYGLYFGEKYTTSIEDDFIQVKASYIFYEDGSMDVIAVSEYVEGIVRYEPYKLWIDETEATISSDGTQVIFADGTFTLESNSGATQSEYGIYFGEKYSGVVDGNNTAYIFYEDGRFDTITTMKFEASSCTYEPYKVLMGGEVFGIVSSDGTQFTDASGAIFTLEADIDVPETSNSVTWRTTDVDGKEIAYSDYGTPMFIKISDLAPTVAELEGAVLSGTNNSAGTTDTHTVSTTDGTIVDNGSLALLMDNLVIVVYDDGVIRDNTSIPTKGIWLPYQLTLADMTLTLTWGGNSNTPETGAHGIYFGKKYNGYAGGDSVSILMSISFGADGSNTVYSGDGNIIANNPAGTVTYEGNAICLNGEPWYIVSEDGVMLISANTNGVGYVLDPSVGITSAVVPDGVTSIGDTNEANFAYYDILTSITIPASVTSISGYAFYGCTSLTTIIFKGTMAQWNAITFGGADWNYNVPATTVTCSDGTVTI